MNRRSQTALEYMMTYGWMAIVIVIVISILFYLGIFGGTSVSPVAISGFPGLVVNTAAANSTFLEFSLSDNLGFPANINNITVFVDGTQFRNFLCNVPLLSTGQETECAVLGNFGDVYTGVSVYINYTVSSSHISGQSSGVIQLTPSKTRLPYKFPLHAVNVTILATNNVPAPFQEEIILNASEFYGDEIANLGNIRFYNASANNSTELYSWCESGCYSQSNYTILWVRLNQSLRANRPDNITLVFEPPTNYDVVYAGEAPQLSPTYAQYDNGANVFTEYWNFAGTSLPSGLSETIGTHGAITFDDKASITLSSANWGTYLTTTSPVSDNNVTEVDVRQYPIVSKGPDSLAALIVSSTPTLGPTSYADYYEFPSSSSANDSEAVYGYNSTGVGFPFSITGSAQTVNTNFNVFSLGINSSGDLGFAMINYQSLSASSNAEVIPSFYIGLQTTNDTATYQWLRVRAYPPGGIMPTARIAGFKVVRNVTIFTQASLPVGTAWSVTYDSITNTSTTDNVTFTAASTGSYSVPSYLHTTPSCEYLPTPSSGSLTAGSIQNIVFFRTCAFNYSVSGNGVYTSSYSNGFSANTTAGYPFYVCAGAVGYFNYNTYVSDPSWNPLVESGDFYDSYSSIGSQDFDNCSASTSAYGNPSTSVMSIIGVDEIPTYNYTVVGTGSGTTTLTYTLYSASNVVLVVASGDYAISTPSSYFTTPSQGNCTLENTEYESYSSYATTNTYVYVCSELPGTYSFPIYPTSWYSWSQVSAAAYVFSKGNSSTLPTVFTETGLPTNTTWSVDYDGVTVFQNTTTTTFIDFRPNTTSTFSYSVPSVVVDGCVYEPSSPSGNLTAGGSVAVTFRCGLSFSAVGNKVYTSSYSNGFSTDINAQYPFYVCAGAVGYYNYNTYISSPSWSPIVDTPASPSSYSSIGTQDLQNCSASTSAYGNPSVSSISMIGTSQLPTYNFTVSGSSSGTSYLRYNLSVRSNVVIVLSSGNYALDSAPGSLVPPEGCVLQNSELESYYSYSTTSTYVYVCAENPGDYSFALAPSSYYSWSEISAAAYVFPVTGTLKTNFTETGLPSNTTWFVDYNGITVYENTTVSNKMTFRANVTGSPYPYSIEGVPINGCIYLPTSSSGSLAAGGSLSVHFACVPLVYGVSGSHSNEYPLSASTTSGYPFYVCDGASSYSGLSSVSWLPIVDSSVTSIGNQEIDTCTVNDSSAYPSGLVEDIFGVNKLPSYNYTAQSTSSPYVNPATLTYTLKDSSYVVISLAGVGYNWPSYTPMQISPAYFAARGCTLKENQSEQTYSYYESNTLVYLCAESPGTYTFSIYAPSGDPWSEVITAAAYVFPTSDVSATVFTESGLPSNASWEVDYNGLTIIRNSTLSQSIAFLPQTGQTYSYSVPATQVNGCAYSPEPYSGSLTAGSSLIINYTSCVFPVNGGISSSSPFSVNTSQGDPFYICTAAKNSGALTSVSWNTLVNDFAFSSGPFTSIGSQDSDNCTSYPGSSATYQSVIGVDKIPTYNYSLTGYIYYPYETEPVFSFHLPIASNVLLVLSGGYQVPLSDEVSYFEGLGCYLQNGESQYPFEVDANTQIYYCPGLSGTQDFMLSASYGVYSYFSAAAYAFPTSDVSPAVFNESGLPSDTQWAVTYNGIYVQDNTSFSKNITFLPKTSQTYPYSILGIVIGDSVYSPPAPTGTVTAGSIHQVDFEKEFNFSVNGGSTESYPLSVSASSGDPFYICDAASAYEGIASVSWLPFVTGSGTSIGSQYSRTCVVNDGDLSSSDFSESVIGVDELPTFNYSASGSYSGTTLSFALYNPANVVIALSGIGQGNYLPFDIPTGYFSSRGCTLESNESEDLSSYYISNTVIYVCPELAGSYSFTIPGRYPYTESVLATAYVFPIVNTTKTAFTESGLPTNASWEVTYNGITIIRNSTVNDSITFLPSTSQTYSYSVPVVQVNGCAYSPAPYSGMQTAGSPLSIVFTACTFNVNGEISSSTPFSVNASAGDKMYFCAGAKNSGALTSVSWNTFINDYLYTYGPFTSIGSQDSDNCTSYPGSSATYQSVIGVDELPTYNYSITDYFYYPYSPVDFSFYLPTTSNVLLIISSGGSQPLSDQVSYFEGLGCYLQNGEGQYPFEVDENTYVYYCPALSGGQSFDLYGSSYVYSYISAAAYAFPTSDTSIANFTESGLPADTQWAMTYNGIYAQDNTSFSKNITFLPKTGQTYSYDVQGVVISSCVYQPPSTTGTLTAGSSQLLDYSCAFPLHVSGSSTELYPLSVSASSGHPFYICDAASAYSGLSSVSWNPLVSSSFTSIGSQYSHTCVVNDSSGNPSDLSESMIGVDQLPTFNYSASGTSSASLSFDLYGPANVVIALSGAGYGNYLPLNIPNSYFSSRGCTLKSNESEDYSSYYISNTLIYVCPELAGSYYFTIPGRYPYTESVLEAAYVFPTSNTTATVFTESGLPTNATWEVDYDGIVITRNSTVNDSITFLPSTGQTYSYSVPVVQVNGCAYSPAPYSGMQTAGTPLSITYTGCVFPANGGISSSVPFAVTDTAGYPFYVCAAAKDSGTISSTSWPTFINDYAYSSGPYTSIGSQASDSCSMSGSSSNTYESIMAFNEIPTFNYSLTYFLYAPYYSEPVFNFPVAQPSNVLVVLAGGYQASFNNPVSYFESEGCYLQNGESQYPYEVDANTQIYYCPDIDTSLSFSISSNYYTYSYFSAAAYVFPISGTSQTVFNESGLPANTIWSVDYNGIEAQGNSSFSDNITFNPLTSLDSYSYSIPVIYSNGCLYLPNETSGSLAVGSTLQVGFSCSFPFTVSGNEDQLNNPLSTSTTSGASIYLCAGASSPFGSISSPSWNEEVQDPYPFSSIGYLPSGNTCTESSTAGGYYPALSESIIGVNELPYSNVTTYGYGSTYLDYSLSNYSLVVIMLAAGYFDNSISTPASYFESKGCFQESDEDAPAYSGYGSNTEIYVCAQPAGTYDLTISSGFYASAAAYIFPVA